MKSLLSFLNKPKCSQKCEEIEGINFKFKKNALSKCVRISLKARDSVLVTMPRHTSFKFARNFALENFSEIKDALKNLSPALKNDSLRRENIERLRREAKEYLPKRLDELAKQFGYKYCKVSIKYMRTRWGSCSFRNNINLNLSLMELEEKLIDYVLLHELVHTVEKNHGEGFWARMHLHMSDAKLRQKIIKSRKVI